MEMDRALIIIDVQRDFCNGGVLAARDSLSLIKPLNECIAWCIAHDVLCVFTRDWHPPDHCSFIPQGGPWPPHCIQGTPGAEFAEGLIVPDSALVIDIEKDSSKSNMSYSAFENTNLSDDLHQLQVSQIAAVGIATDYCVRATVLDALNINLRVQVLIDLIRPIDAKPGDSSKAIAEMRSEGAILSTSSDWMKSS